MVTHPCDTGMNPLWSWCMILFMCDTFLDLVCWDFVEDFCIYIHQRYWPIIFFFGGVFVWFWYQDGGGFIEGHLECFLLFNLLEEFEKDWYKFFLVCLAEFPSEAFLDYCFLFFLFFFFKFYYKFCFLLGFPGSSDGKESTCNAGDTSSIPGSGRSPGEGIGYPFEYSWASLVAQKANKSK